VNFKNICITGGAGFVGSNLAIAFKRANPSVNVLAFDSLKRRGSELALDRLHTHGVQFQHGDIRCTEDLAALPSFDLLLDCSAEPSVHAGATGSPVYLLNTNLTGTIHVLEAARLRGAAVLFLSSSRIYPMDRINALHFKERDTRFTWQDNEGAPGISDEGLAEDFPITGVRSFYGASKLASEMILQEYVNAYRVKALINRCGVIAGPWQMGKVDQGVITLWVARHIFAKPLSYIGYGGTGKQVRDVIHIDDLADLLLKQCDALHTWDGRIYNVGGGDAVSTSLLELTTLCREVTGKKISIAPVADTAPMDVRIYVSDARRVMRDYAWKPTRDMRAIVADVHNWVLSNRARLEPILG
jgi:CDP-paratose 2-epimerase